MVIIQVSAMDYVLAIYPLVLLVVAYVSFSFYNPSCSFQPYILTLHKLTCSFLILSMLIGYSSSVTNIIVCGSLNPAHPNWLKIGIMTEGIFFTCMATAEQHYQSIIPWKVNLTPYYEVLFVLCLHIV